MDPETTDDKIEKLKQYTMQGHGTLDGTYKIDDWIPNEEFTVSYSSENVGTVDSLDPDTEGMTFNIGTEYTGTEDMFEVDLRKKYPALKQAHEHYQNIKQMCETREKEEDGS